MKELKKILDVIPFNGSKTALGALMLLLGAAQSALGVDVSEIVSAVADAPSKTGIALLIVGIAHKVLKARVEEREQR